MGSDMIVLQFWSSSAAKSQLRAAQLLCEFTRNRTLTFTGAFRICVYNWSQYQPTAGLTTQGLPFLHLGPLNPVMHKQRYPLSVKPLWQVALLSQGLSTQALWGQKKNSNNLHIIRWNIDIMENEQHINQQ